jgi:hypothetical protein
MATLENIYILVGRESGLHELESLDLIYDISRATPGAKAAH